MIGKDLLPSLLSRYFPGPLLYDGIFSYQIYVVGETKAKFVCKDRRGRG